MTLLSLGLSFVLLLSCAAPFISPISFWFVSLFGFIFPYIYVINIITLVFLIRAHKKVVYLHLLTLVFASFFITRNFAFNWKKDQANGLKVMTWNVKCFDLYNWSHNKETAEKMMNLIRKENPDILCLQEFYTDSKEYFNLEFIQHDLGYRYVHFKETTILRNRDRWGIATFSKYPIDERDSLVFDHSKNNVCIISQVKYKGKKYQVFNAHMQSLHFGYNDYAYLEDLKKDIHTNNWQKSQSILSKLKTAYHNRSNQSLIISKAVQEAENPIVCGDFNDIPMSFTYQNISKGMQDAFVAKGLGFSKSIDLFIPNLRIDYIFTSSKFKVNSYKVINKNLSDHYPLIISFD